MKKDYFEPQVEMQLVNVIQVIMNSPAGPPPQDDLNDPFTAPKHAL